MTIDDLIKDRETTHGDFENNAFVSQVLKKVMRQTKNWDGLPNASKEALEMIATKIARVLNGDASNSEHWNDIAGYARLRANALAPVLPRADLEDGISQIAKRLRPVPVRVNDEGGAA